jgi:hypothetical protein
MEKKERYVYRQTKIYIYIKKEKYGGEREREREIIRPIDSTKWKLTKKDK